MTEEPLRVDVALDRLCLTRSRNEAKVACDAGAILVDGKPVKASYLVSAGDVVTIRFAQRLLELRIEQLPPKSISKKAARDLYSIVREERTPLW